jgi:hypothetical protein
MLLLCQTGIPIPRSSTGWQELVVTPLSLIHMIILITYLRDLSVDEFLNLESNLKFFKF